MPIELRVLLAWGLAFAATYWLTPFMFRVADKTGIVDVPRGRHAHAQTTPLLGGLAIFAGVMLAAELLAPSLAFAVALPLALGAGLVDDYCKTHGKELPALPKLVLQLLPATTLVLLGHTIDHISNPFSGGILILPWWLDYPLTLAWLIGMTNAVNFLDGMDGMVAGLTAVATFALLIIALVRGAAPTAVWVAATLGACIAFLRYNFPPASIFMGDTGSNFLGFLLAAIAVTGYFKVATLAGVAAPMLVLALPMLNVGFVIFRRMRKGKSLIQALTEADLEHSFNVFRRRTNFNPKETVLIFLLAAMALSLSALGVVSVYR
ncbi:MAG: undecaprenyl-phosphate alpha-N-acetylglucosaminyl 1-phosphate transferase [Firmicutes bacterium]|nr:undecaprenyl-phosphate alpha-N-acetylglucosaminyl 1-phosphate transferase [Bacillota bacterium]